MADLNDLYHFIDGWIWGQVFTEANQLDICSRQGIVATGTRVEPLSAVPDHNVLSPVSRTSPSTALHLVI